MKDFKTLFSVTLSLSSIFLSQSASASCFYRGEASIRGLPGVGIMSVAATAESEELWDDTERVTFKGDRLFSQIAHLEGPDLVYQGPAIPGFLSFGPYEDIKGVQTSAQASIRFSIEWTPDGEEYCSKKKLVPFKGNKCVEKSWRSFPTSFAVDIAARGGSEVYYRKQFDNVHNVRLGLIDLPSIQCDGNLEGLEVRIVDLQGGSGTFIVHEVMIDKYWKN